MSSSDGIPGVVILVEIDIAYAVAALTLIPSEGLKSRLLTYIVISDQRNYERATDEVLLSKALLPLR